MKLLGYTAVVSAMRDRLAEDGSIVLFGGRAKDRPYPGGMTVGTVNAGISGMMRALAVQLAPRRVNAIHPGIVADSPYWSENQEFTEKVRQATPTGRNVTIEDIVDGVDFLIRNRSVNGIDLYVDGGWLAAMRVALVGAGRMGSAMGGRVAAAGHDLVVFNRTRSRAEDVARRTGAQVADTAREAAESRRDLPGLPCRRRGGDRDIPRRQRADRVVVQPGAVVCDLSTVAPATVRGLAPLVAQKGATLIDTPVSGSVSVVESGTLTVMVGGDQAALDRARPVLEAFAKSIFHLGDVGAGATMKLVVNSLVHSLNVAVSEALVLAEKAGLDRETVYDIFEAGAAGAPYVKYKREAFLRAR